MIEKKSAIADSVKAESEEVKSVVESQGEHVIRSVVHLAAFGVSVRQIGKSLGIPQTKVKLILKSITVQNEIYRIQEELYERDTKRMFMRMLPEAAAITYKMMKSKKTKDMTKLAAANMIMDRAIGKPTQHVVEEKSELKEVFAKLNERVQNKEDRLNQAETVIETTGTKVEDKPKEPEKDPLDAMLDSI